MFAHRYLASIMAAGLIVTSSVALANSPTRCQLPSKVQQEVNHLPVNKAKAVRAEFKQGCEKHVKLTRLIKAKHAMLDALMRQPKINVSQVKQLTKEISHLQRLRLNTEVKTNEKIAAISPIRPGLNAYKRKPWTHTPS